MEKELVNFNENITKLNKDICKYEDEKGNVFIIPTGQLFAACEYLELKEDMYKKAKFEGLLDKNIEYETKKVVMPVCKYDITHINKDKNTIIDSEVEVHIAWVVRNGLKVSKAFTNKEEALKVVNEINEKYINFINE